VGRKFLILILKGGFVMKNNLQFFNQKQRKEKDRKEAFLLKSK
jgi:hypothetical protein